MRRILLSLVCGIVVLATCIGTELRGAAQEPNTDVKRRIADLECWLGDNPHAAGWRKYLRLRQLAAELDKGDAADRQLVQEILDRYTSNTPGLQRRRFTAVRDALASWLSRLPRWQADHLPEAARTAKARYIEVMPDDVGRERQRLVAAVDALKRFLDSATPDAATKWKETINWPQLEAALAADERPDARRLLATLDSFYQDVPGLERSEFMAVREALDTYANLTLFAAAEKSRTFYENHLDSLAERLVAYQQQPTTDEANAIGKILGWMDRFGQASDLVASTRSQWSRPNLFIEVSEALAQAGVEQSVDQTAPVNEIILGTRVRGNARLTGAVTLDLVPSDQEAAINILLNGSTVSDNVGYNGPVRIFSRGFSTVAAQKRLALDATGLSSRPASTRCSTRTRIGRVEAGRLIRHIAMKRIQQSKSEAEAIASRRTASRVSTSVDGQSRNLLDDANTRFHEKFRLPLVRRGGFPQQLKFRTTDDTLLVTMLQAGRDHLGAPNDPPPLAGKFDLAVRFHESLVGNLSQAVFGGVTLTNESLAKMIEEMTGKVPDELAVTEDSEPWSITFTSELPIEARFDGQTAKIIIRGKRFGRADQEVRKLLEISALYTVEKMSDHARLTRQGDVAVDFIGRQQLSAADIAMKTFMKKKFEGLFKPEIVSEGLVLPERWKGLGKFRLEQLDCDRTWLVLGWQKPTRTETNLVAQN